MGIINRYTKEQNRANLAHEYHERLVETNKYEFYDRGEGYEPASKRTVMLLLEKEMIDRQLIHFPDDDKEYLTYYFKAIKQQFDESIK